MLTGPASLPSLLPQSLQLEWCARVAELSADMLESVESFRAKFSGKYLHRYLCLFLERLPHLNGPWSSSFELLLASVLLGSNFFTRWIRTAPIENVELLFVLLVEKWEKSCPDLATLFEGPRKGDQVSDFSPSSALSVD